VFFQVVTTESMDENLLGYGAIALMMEAVFTSETSVYF
jgi:hypothetical protein